MRLIFALSLLAVLPARAATPAFDYLVPGIGTSPDGREQIAVFQEGAEFNCYVVAVGAGELRIVSEKLPVCPGEAVDPRGYGLDQVVWSKERSDDSLMPLASRFFAVDHMYRKDNTVYFLRRGDDGIFHNLSYNSDVYSQRALVVPLIQAVLRKRGIKVTDDKIAFESGGFQLMQPIYNAGDKAYPVEHDFLLSEGMLGQERDTYSVDLGNLNYLQIDANFDVSLTFASGELVAKVVKQSVAIEK